MILPPSPTYTTHRPACFPAEAPFHDYLFNVTQKFPFPFHYMECFSSSESFSSSITGILVSSLWLGKEKKERTDGGIQTTTIVRCMYCIIIFSGWRQGWVNGLTDWMEDGKMDRTDKSQLLLPCLIDATWYDRAENEEKAIKNE